MNYTIHYKKPTIEAQVYTKTVYTREAFEKLLAFCDERCIFIVSTEINGCRTDDFKHHGVQQCDSPDTRMRGSAVGWHEMQYENAWRRAHGYEEVTMWHY